MTNEEYVDKHGKVCPFCGADSNEFDYDHVEMAETTASQEVECLKCHKKWWDVYTLSGFEPR